MKIGISLRQFVLAGLMSALLFILWQNSLFLLAVFFHLESMIPKWFAILAFPFYFLVLFLLWCRLSGSAFITAKGQALIWQWRRIDFGVLIGTLLASFAYSASTDYSNEFKIYQGLIEIFLFIAILLLCLPTKPVWRVDFGRMLYIIWVILVLPAWDLQP
jgi:hypothetical protein